MSRVIKIYHTKTREEYDYLMGKLGKVGYIWSFSGGKLCDSDGWRVYKDKTVIGIFDDMTITYGGLDDYTVKKSRVVPVAIPMEIPETVINSDVYCIKLLDNDKGYLGYRGIDNEFFFTYKENATIFKMDELIELYADKHNCYIPFLEKVIIC